MRRFAVLFSIIVPLLAQRQTWKSKPVSISLFSNATLLPPGYFAAGFKEIRVAAMSIAGAE